MAQSHYSKSTATALRLSVWGKPAGVTPSNVSQPRWLCKVTCLQTVTVRLWLQIGKDLLAILEKWQFVNKEILQTHCSWSKSVFIGCILVILLYKSKVAERLNLNHITICGGKSGFLFQMCEVLSSLWMQVVHVDFCVCRCATDLQFLLVVNRCFITNKPYCQPDPFNRKLTAD